jgi:cytochrome c553
MDLLRDAPTRSLDTFEMAALADLRAGKTLATRDENARVRMVGAIRATKHCTACHACERGELLGAFSYLLRQM